METYGKLQIQIRGEQKLLDALKSKIDAKLEVAGGVRQDAAAVAFAELLSAEPGEAQAQLAELKETNSRLSDNVCALNSETADLRKENADLKKQLEQIGEQEPEARPELQWYNEKLACILFELIKSDDENCRNIKNVDDAVNYILKPYWDAGVLVPEDEDLENFRQMMGGLAQ